jgi:hypothetical protein
MFMTRTKMIVVGILWALSLVVVAVAVASAQAWAYRPLPEPRVFTGAEVGFRVEGMTGEMPTGDVVIRVNDQWVKTKLGAPTPTR